MTKTTKRLSLLLASAALGIAAFAPGAQASFSCFEDSVAASPSLGPEAGFGIAPGCFDGAFQRGPGDPLAATTAFSQAGGHPYALTTTINPNTRRRSEVTPFFGGGEPMETPYPEEPAKTIVVEEPEGFIGNPTVAAQCPLEDLVRLVDGSPIVAPCPIESQVGILTLRLGVPGGGVFPVTPIPVYNVVPPTGTPARFGFNVFGVTTTLDASLRSEGDYGISVATKNISEGLANISSDLTFWGTPADKSHDPERYCADGSTGCSSNAAHLPFLTMPTACTAPGEGLETNMRIDSWADPGDFHAATYTTHDPPGLPSDTAYPRTVPPSTPWGDERGAEGCESVEVAGSLEAEPTTRDTESASGLKIHVEVPNPGLENPAGIASSHLKKVKVSLPQGVTINPSQAEGLGVCSPSRYESTVLSFFPTPGKGCPDESKIGSVEAETPLLEEPVGGDVYVAQQDDPRTSAPGAENPFDSLLALYIVIKDPERGILIKLPGELELSETTGRISATFDDLPQVPFSSFDFKFREGARAPLVTPPTCGTYTTTTEITGWSDPDGPPILSESSFQVDRGIGGGPCPPAGVPPFKPGFSAGSINNNAASFSPFNMRITRKDGEQDMTRFSAVLPPGVLGKLAGVDKCPDSAIAIAKSKTGNQEKALPSCPANSEIGHSLVGAGVGSVLTYVPGKVYLGGPFNGDPLSVIAITPVVAGPFDVGTVVVHEALTLDPKTAEVEVDGAASEPIPHILKGIPAKLRDLRVYVDRPDFTLNPTSCDPSSAKATLFGGYLDVFSPADDVPVALSDRYQAANCLNLGFNPKLALNLKGGTKRGGHPALKAIYTPKKGDANIKGLVVRLPRSAFLDQAHIKTICTRVQFAAEACPARSQYGYIKAWTPLLDTPLEGPVYLRSSNHKLPDLVFDLHGLVDIEVGVRIDSAKGGIRATLEDSPDAPLSKVDLRMQGAKKGLIINSRNLCGSTNRANVEFEGQNGKQFTANPVMQSECGGKRKAR